MSLKQNDLDLLERKYSMYMVLLVDKHPGMTKTELIRFEDGNEKTKFNRITELIDEGVLEYKKIGEQTVKGVYLTETGSELANRIKKVRLSVIKLNKNNSESESEDED